MFAAGFFPSAEFESDLEGETYYCPPYDIFRKYAQKNSLPQIVPEEEITSVVEDCQSALLAFSFHYLQPSIKL